MTGECTNLNNLLTLTFYEHGAAAIEMHVIKVLVNELRVVFPAEFAFILWVIPIINHLLLFGYRLFGLFFDLVHRLLLNISMLTLHILNRDLLIIRWHLLLGQ